MKTAYGKKRLLCLLLAAAVCAAGWLLPDAKTLAAGVPTSLGFAEHGLNAYRDGWRYQAGAKGYTDSDGVRYSDCAGLLYAYFSDLGVSGCNGGASSQVKGNCIFSNDISEGIPNIHGLAITSPDYYDPGSGVYGHIGIYVGNNTAADNSDYDVNMLLGPVVGSRRRWNAWHVFDNGMRYPADGWYVFDGKMVHYTDYEYDVDTWIDGYELDGEGYALDEDGGFAAVDPELLSSEYASASQVAAYLRTKYSGKDSTYELVFGISQPDPDPPESYNYNGKIIGSGVRLRQSPNTQSEILDTLSLGTQLEVLGEESGETISANGRVSDQWCLVKVHGRQGYVCSLYVERYLEEPPAAPVITCSNGRVAMSSSAGASIYYTTDLSEPSERNELYSEPVSGLGRTYKAVAVRYGKKSPVTTVSVMSNGAIFTDLHTGHWYFDEVDQAVSAQIFRGTGNNLFAPEKVITRGQFVTALANLDGVDLSRFTGDPGFTDVTNTNTSRTSQAIVWAASNEIVLGYADGTFRPNAPISREQMCVILVRYSGLTRHADSQPFDDDAEIAAWARDAVYACRDNGIIKGVGNNRFNPKGTAIRAQACTVAVNFYNYSR